MRAGPLRHRLQIQSAAKTRNASGGFTDSWSTDRTAWGSVEPISGREFFSENRAQADITHRIRLRHAPGLTNRHRIKFGTRVFNISQVINSGERGIMHEVLATEAV